MQPTCIGATATEMSKLAPETLDKRRRALESWRNARGTVPALPMDCNIGITRAQVIQEIADAMKLVRLAGFGPR